MPKSLGFPPGNPCCEEADYRFTLIDAIGSVAILDCHTVTPSERKQVLLQQFNNRSNATYLYSP